MAINTGTPDGHDGVLSTINTTPLVDVMLVLLIIFLITIPAVTSSVAVSLPKERVDVLQTKPENIVLSVDKAGKLFWKDSPVANTSDLTKRLKKLSAMQPQPEVQIRGDMEARYDGVGKVIYACQLAGILKVTFITEPPAQSI